MEIKEIKKNIALLFYSACIVLLLFGLLKYTIYHFRGAQRSLTVLAWMDTFSPETIEEFEKKTGIKINIAYYTSNEELIAKIFLTKGENIDIIIPSDYALYVLLQDELLKSIDTSKIKQYPKLYPFLLFNEKMESSFSYAIPIEWGVYGLAYQQNLNVLFTNPHYCVDAFFNGKFDNKTFSLGMINDILAACNVAWNYYIYTFKNIVPDEKAVFSILYELLKKQFTYVKAYADTTVIPLLKNKSVDIAYLQSDEYIRYLNQELNPSVVFMLPPGNIVKTVEYIAFSKTIKNIPEAYEFINFILSKKTSLHTVNKLGYFPVRNDIIKHKDISEKIRTILNSTIERGTQLKSVGMLLDEKNQMMLWMKLKS